MSISFSCSFIKPTFGEKIFSNESEVLFHWNCNILLEVGLVRDFRARRDRDSSSRLVTLHLDVSRDEVGRYNVYLVGSTMYVIMLDTYLCIYFRAKNTPFPSEKDHSRLESCLEILVSKFSSRSIWSRYNLKSREMSQMRTRPTSTFYVSIY
jgi:hypothetical protein